MRKIATVAVAAFSVVAVLSFFISASHTPDLTKYGASDWTDAAPIDDKGKRAFDREQAYQRNIWGIAEPAQFYVVEQSVSEPVVEDQEQRKNVDIKLLGIIKENDKFLALIKYDENEVMAFAENATIGDFTVEKIVNNQVVIVSNEQNKKLTLFEQ